jgi:hypothetical protein
MHIELRPTRLERLHCSDCAEVTDFAIVSAPDGADRGERACVHCGQARWVPTDAGAPQRVAAAA